MVPSNTYNMLQCFCGLVLSAVLAFATLTGTQAACPLQLNPRRVVVRYGDSVTAYCSTSVPHQGMGWEASEGAVPMTKDQSLITWTVSELTEWDIKPFCYMNYKIGDLDQCLVELPVTVYKTPDSVSISTVDHSGPMIEGEQYELKCDVHDVAPVQNLTVKWYKGQTLLNQTTFNDTIETLVNETVTLLIRPDRADDGAQYWCEAELDLGAEGPQPPPTNSSKPLNVEVHYKPQHSNSTETIIKKNEATLDCTVKANPAPRYTWDHLQEEISSSVLQASALTPGNYTCIATNALGRDSKVFIVKSTDRTTFWAIVLSGVAVAVVLIASYLAMAVQGTREAMVDQETWEAVADQETWEAMADLPPRPRPQPPPRLLRLKPYYPPKKKYLVELTVLNLGTGARPGLNWGSGALTGLDSGTGASPGTNVTS